MGVDEFIFQQDNAPCHKSKMTMEYLSHNNVDLMEWPPQSPDLNPIENLWGFIGLEKENYHPKNQNELASVIKKIWSEIPSDLLERLVKGMHKRCLAVIKVNGGHINY